MTTKDLIDKAVDDGTISSQEAKESDPAELVRAIRRRTQSRDRHDLLASVRAAVTALQKLQTVKPRLQPFEIEQIACMIDTLGRY